jgi:hypothetical protein
VCLCGQIQPTGLDHRADAEGAGQLVGLGAAGDGTGNARGGLGAQGLDELGARCLIFDQQHLGLVLAGLLDRPGPELGELEPRAHYIEDIYVTVADDGSDANAPDIEAKRCCQRVAAIGRH